MDKPDCKYGASCYQKNPAHKEKYKHPPTTAASEAKGTAGKGEKSPKKASPPKRHSGSPVYSTAKVVTDESPEKDVKSPAKTNQPASTSKRHSGSPVLSTTKVAADISPEQEGQSPGKPKQAETTSKRRSDSPDNSELLEVVKKCKRPPTPEKDDNNDEESDKNHEYFGMTRQRYALPEVPMDVGLMSDIYDPQIEFSKKAEYKELCGDPKQFIKHKFLVDMPDCFDSLWKFCLSKSAAKPEDVFDKFGLRLVGPFDVLAKKFNNAKMHEPGDYLRHWRFYYDPPEFQTVLVKKGSGVHYGYWRDQPDETTGLVAMNDVNKGCEFKMIGENIFDAVMNFLDHEVTVTPFNKALIASMKKSLEEWAKTHDIKLKGGDKLKARGKAIVCKTFHRAGIVVPFDRKKELGYRELLESDSNLKKMLSKFDKIDNAPDKIEFDAAMSFLQPVVTGAFIAVDECDFGTALELAIDLFCHGTKNLHEVMKPLFVTAYSMLQRPQYIAIIKSHLDDRRRGIDLDLLTK